MTEVRTSLAFVAAVFFAGPHVWADCRAEATLVHEERDVATIRLEAAWNKAFLTADTEFEACLLTPDFTEIMADGTINHLREELALAERNKGGSAASPSAGAPASFSTERSGAPTASPGKRQSTNFAARITPTTTCGRTAAGACSSPSRPSSCGRGVPAPARADALRAARPGETAAPGLTRQLWALSTVDIDWFPLGDALAPCPHAAPRGRHT